MLPGKRIHLMIFMVGCVSVYLCVHTWAYIISVHVFSWWIINIHGCLLESGLGGDFLNDCQISRSAHKDPKTQACLISFKRIETFSEQWNEWMNKSLLTFSKCLSNAGHVDKLPEASADPNCLSPQHWSSLQFMGLEPEMQAQYSPGQATSFLYQASLSAKCG